MATANPLVDAAGTRHLPAAAGARIVSLVPSITELICDLGLAAQLVGRTGFCVHPAATVRTIPKLGGTKDVNIERLRELAPTHVVLNVDENRRETAEELMHFVPHLIVTHPLAPRDNLPLYRLIGGIFDRYAEAEALCRRFEDAYAEVRAATRLLPRERVLYLIWKNPWMAVSRDTYIARTLGAVGWVTLPEASRARYPTVSFESQIAMRAHRLLLSSEPYRFGERDIAGMHELPALHDKRITLIDGEMTSWYGSRAIEGLRYLAKLRLALSKER
jgi:ABC-type Fe3+-hydroxamate transport system substrate-binding protein